MYTTLGGITMLVREVLPLNEEPPILVTLAGMEIPVSE
jgi:hypothetical protein